MIVFLTFKILTKPLKKLEQALERLSDGNVGDKIILGGGKQFVKMEYDLNKINENYRKKENIIKQTNVEYEKYIPKQFVKFLGKNSILDLQVGTQVKKEVTTLISGQILVSLLYDSYAIFTFQNLLTFSY